jgi:hypothetical protein
VTAYEHGNERRYYFDRALWGQFLRFQPSGWPTYRDWPRVLGAFRRLSRWLYEPTLDQLTPYMLASNARTLMDQLEPDLVLAGALPPGAPSLEGEQYWDSFVARVETPLRL